MLRRTPFARKTYVPAPSPPVTRATRAGTIELVTATVRCVPKDPPPVRDKAYLKLVASLECYHCGAERHSQAAHPHGNKAKGLKKDDDRVFPMCTVSARDCHGKLDTYQIVPKGPEMETYERAAYEWTVRTLIARGLWPLKKPVPDLRVMN